jgi:hypothetical protein
VVSRGSQRAIRSGPAAGAVRPLPRRHCPQRVQLIISLRMGVLLGNLRAELDVGPQRLAERRVIGKARSIRGGHVQLDESLSLRLSDVQPAMHIDQMSEAKLPREVVRASERFRFERGQMVNMVWPSGAEQRLKHRIGEHAAVEDIDEVTQDLVPARVPIERFHDYIVTQASLAMRALPYRELICGAAARWSVVCLAG